MRKATFVCAALLAACTGNAGSADSPASSSPVPAPSAADLAAKTEPGLTPTASAVPTSAASALTSSAPLASASAAPAASAAEPLPDVDVKNIGMHIGGGPNDAETKAPIKRSVAPHFDAIKRCYAKADEPKKGDVSIDLKIDKAGGKAEVRKLKSGIPGAAFSSCLTDLFTTIDFEKPKTGTTVVSYSLRFSPGKDK